MVVLRFLVAMGVGGEWAVASAMVAEVMPKRSRPVMSSTCWTTTPLLRFVPRQMALCMSGGVMESWLAAGFLMRLCPS